MSDRTVILLLVACVLVLFLVNSLFGYETFFWTLLGMIGVGGAIGVLVFIAWLLAPSGPGY